MNESGNSPSSVVVQQVSDILKPTLHDNDFLQSFVRIGLEDALDTRHPNFGEEKRPKRGSKGSINRGGGRGQLGMPEASLRRTSRGRIDLKDRGSVSRHGRSIQDMLDEEMKHKTRKKRRRRSDVTHRQEEIYTDKDRAAAVNMGSKDIKQSLKLKRRQDRSKELQIPEEAEPSAMLALGMREMRCGDVSIAINCINKVRKYHKTEAVRGKMD